MVQVDQLQDVSELVKRSVDGVVDTENPVQHQRRDTVTDDLHVQPVDTPHTASFPSTSRRPAQRGTPSIASLTDVGREQRPLLSVTPTSARRSVRGPEGGARAKLEDLVERVSVDERISMPVDPHPLRSTTLEHLGHSQVPATWLHVAPELDGRRFDEHEPCDVAGHRTVQHLDVASARLELGDCSTLSRRCLGRPDTRATEHAEDGRGLVVELVAAAVAVDPGRVIAGDTVAQLLSTSSSIGIHSVHDRCVALS